MRFVIFVLFLISLFAHIKAKSFRPPLSQVVLKPANPLTVVRDGYTVSGPKKSGSFYPSGIFPAKQYQFMDLPGSKTLPSPPKRH